MSVKESVFSRDHLPLYASEECLVPSDSGVLFSIRSSVASRLRSASNTFWLEHISRGGFDYFASISKHPILEVWTWRLATNRHQQANLCKSEQQEMKEGSYTTPHSGTFLRMYLSVQELALVVFSLQQNCAHERKCATITTADRPT